MSDIYFTSDNHWGHKAVLKFCPASRPFKTVEEMDEALIAAWQATVKPKDTVWLLGDVFWCNAARAVEILQQLPGKKNLILGNHDAVIRNNSSIQEQFESIQDYKELKIAKHLVVLCHYPLARWNRSHYGSFMLHGHEHGNYNAPGRILDVGIDGPITPQFSPIHYDLIAEYLHLRPITGHH